jgi:hypothetical protein
MDQSSTRMAHKYTTNKFTRKNKKMSFLFRSKINGSRFTTGELGFAECRRLCRVLNVGHLAKSFLPSVRYSAKTGTLQRASLPSAGHLAKDGPRQRADGGTCRQLSPSAPVRHSAKYIFFLFFASKLFLQPLYIKLKYILKFGTFFNLFFIYP